MGRHQRGDYTCARKLADACVVGGGDSGEGREWGQSKSSFLVFSSRKCIIIKIGCLLLQS